MKCIFNQNFLQLKKINFEYFNKCIAVTRKEVQIKLLNSYKNKPNTTVSLDSTNLIFKCEQNSGSAIFYIWMLHIDKLIASESIYIYSFWFTRI